MYYIGEGDNNLKKMDKHLKTKQGNSMALFNSQIINDQKLKKVKKGTLNKLSSKCFTEQQSQMSHRTAATVQSPVTKTHLMMSGSSTGFMSSTRVQSRQDRNNTRQSHFPQHVLNQSHVVTNIGSRDQMQWDTIKENL